MSKREQNIHNRARDKAKEEIANRAKDMAAHAKTRANKIVVPAMLVTVEEQIESLRDLRRRLCGYANSENRCDCKYLVEPGTLQPASFHGGVIPERMGELTGCCEVRVAIAALDAVRQSFYTLEARGAVANEACTHCGHSKEHHNYGKEKRACCRAGCSCRRFRQRLAIA